MLSTLERIGVGRLGGIDGWTDRNPSIAENSHLDAGMTMEKTLYYSTFGLEDFKEGISALLEKRSPKFKHE